MDTFLVNEVVLGPITVSEQIAKVLAGILTVTKKAGRELGKKEKPKRRMDIPTATYDGKKHHSDL